MIAAENINSFWASLCIEELVRNGITFFCISPGSRSTPLTLAATRHAKTECLLCHDERGAAFCALGYARARGPAALICTSGTAAANYFPAVIEASLDAVPMILLTADRPPELLETGANQAIRQQKLYGDYTRWDFVFPTPSSEISPRFVLTTINQAVYRCHFPVPGPVHLNCMFREPLTPEPIGFTLSPDFKFEGWQNSSKPFTSYSPGQNTLQTKSLHALAALLDRTEKGLVIVGRRPAQQQQSLQVPHFLHALNWPVYADIGSGLRLGPPKWPVWDEKYFYSNRLCTSWQPDSVLQIGGSFISKRLQSWLEHNPPSHYIHCDTNPRRQDPGHLITERYDIDFELCCGELAVQIHPSAPSFDFQLINDLIHSVDAEAEKTLSLETLNEPGVAMLVSRLIPGQHGLFLGNSLPIRDMNTFALRDGPAVPVATNRGASGIDGSIATAVGFACGLARPVTAIIGDVAALHDLNSLILMKKAPPIFLIIINNNGGGLFSFLPISQYKQDFETWFETPHNLSFEKAAQLFDVPWAQPTSMAVFKDVYRRACLDEKSIIIEIQTNKRDNFTLHQQVEQKMARFINSKL